MNEQPGIQATIELGALVVFTEPLTLTNIERMASAVAFEKKKMLRAIQKKAAALTVEDLKFKDVKVPLQNPIPAADKES